MEKESENGFVCKSKILCQPKSSNDLIELESASSSAIEPRERDSSSSVALIKEPVKSPDLFFVDVDDNNIDDDDDDHDNNECMHLISDLAKSCESTSAKLCLCSKHKRFEPMIKNYMVLRRSLRLKREQSSVHCKQNRKPTSNDPNCRRALNRKKSFSFFNSMLIKFGCMKL